MSREQSERGKIKLRKVPFRSLWEERGGLGGEEKRGGGVTEDEICSESSRHAVILSKY